MVLLETVVAPIISKVLLEIDGAAVDPIALKVLLKMALLSIRLR